MTGLVVHQCPKCELRFSFRTELEHHLNIDHAAPTAAAPTSVKVDKAPVPHARPPAPPVRPPVAPARPGRWPTRLAGFLLTLGSVLLVTCVAIFVSISTAVVVAVLVLVLAAIQVRRSRGRARPPRL